MATTTSNLAMGPGDLYVGDFGATEPAATVVALASPPDDEDWRDVGGTLGGLTMTVAQQFKELEVDQLVEVPERRVTRREASFKTQLAEVTLDNLVLALNSGTITPGTAGAADIYEPDEVNSGDSPNYKAIVFDGWAGGGKRRRCIIRKVLSTENVDIVASKDGQTSYGVTFMSHYVSPSIKSHRILQAPAA